jgi:hypothetical protein
MLVQLVVVPHEGEHLLHTQDQFLDRCDQF